MTRILLATTALVAFAGAAAADGHTGVSFTATAELGYNDTNVISRNSSTPLNPSATDGEDDNVGFYADLDIIAGLSAELDNGLTAAASINLNDLGTTESGTDDLDEDLFGNAGSNIDYELSLTSETSGLYYGQTNFAAQNMWISAGDMEGDNFSEADGEEALRAEVTFGNIEAQVSYVLANNANTRVGEITNDDLDQLSVGVQADFGNVNVSAAYQAASDVPVGGYTIGTAGPDGIVGTPGSAAEADNTPGAGDNGDFVNDEVFGISVGTSFAGADVRVAYAQNESDESFGVQVAYPFGPVTATVYYVLEESTPLNNDDDNYGLTLAYATGPITATFDYDNDQGTDKYGLEGAYDVGNGVTVFAGYLYFEGLTNEAGSSEESAAYIAGTYDLGSGAELLVSYAEGNDAEYGDEIGAGDYQDGSTVQVSFQF